MTYKLFSNCMPVKGVGKSVVVDIQRGSYNNIPNSLFEILTTNQILDFEALKIKFDNSKIIDEYKSFLLKNEYIFECTIDELERFPALSTTFETPFHISNAVVEYSTIGFSNLKTLKNSFDELGIQACFLVFYEDCEIELVNFLEEFNDSRLLSIQLLAPFNQKLNINKIAKKYQRLTNIILFNSKVNKQKDFVTYTTKSFSNSNFCGAINGYFSINIDTYLESLNHNSCLNKKISIDKDGFIRNCPSMPQHFGNIKDTTLEEALNHPDFKKYWNVTKDMIAVCKDCEFRHICTDCRAYTERTHFEEDIDLSKPLKCGYNPYTNEWAEWSTNPLKEKAIEYYGMQDLVKKDA